MTLTAFALIIVAGIIHAFWNIVAKKAGGDARFSLFTSVLNAAVWLPLGWWLGRDVVPHWGWLEWGFVAASALLHVFYFVVLLRGYRVADLTVVYPLARGSGPLISSLVAVLFLGEHLSTLGAAGIVETQIGDLAAIGRNERIGVGAVAIGERGDAAAGDVERVHLAFERIGFPVGLAIGGEIQRAAVARPTQRTIVMIGTEGELARCAAARASDHRRPRSRK